MYLAHIYLCLSIFGLGVINIQILRQSILDISLHILTNGLIFPPGIILTCISSLNFRIFPYWSDPSKFFHFFVLLSFCKLDLHHACSNRSEILCNLIAVFLCEFEGEKKRA